MNYSIDKIICIATNILPTYGTTLSWKKF